MQSVLLPCWWRSINIDELAPFLFILGLSVILVALLTTVSTARKRHPPLPPGPGGLPLVGHLPFMDRSIHTYFTGLARTYGPILSLRLGQKVCVVVSSPSLAKEVFKDNDLTFANHDVPAAAKAGVYGGISMLWSPYGPEWRMLRKIAVRQLIGAAALDSTYYGVRRREVRRMMGHIYGRMGSPINMGEQMFMTMVNVMTSMLWSRTAAGEAEWDAVGAEFRRWMAEFTALLGMPNVSDLFPCLRRFDMQGVERRMRECSRRFDKMFDDIIDQRLKLKDERKEDNKDFLQALLELTDDRAAKTALTMSHVKALLLDMITGGTDTVATAMEYAMAEMINRPEIMENLRRETDSVVGKDNVIEESHLHKLPYLLAAVKESLRLHPPAPLLAPHRPSKLCTVGGYTIPEGSRMFVNVWSIHRDPSIWEEPLQFMPERFVDSKCDFGGNDFTYLPFGSGRRICPGTAMAERLMMLILASLLHSFDWKTAEGQNLDFEEEPGILARKKRPLIVIASPRLSDPGLYL